MTKTKLYKIALSVHESNRYIEHYLNHCKAWYYTDENLHAVALRSYRSIVAVYWCGVVWEFERWSNITTQHVRKFARLMESPVVSLYHTSGMNKRDFESHEKYDWQDVIDAALST